MLNLLIHYDKKAWDKTPANMEKDRCFTEYISLGLKNQFSDWSEESIEKIKKIPCLFAYEKKHGLDACIGYIKYIEVSEKYIGFDYKLTGQTIAFDDLMKLGERFGIDEWEWDRTHWTMKEIDLEMLEPYLKGKDVSKPEIFVLYNRTSPEHRQKIEAVIDRLEKDGINVRYYENVLRPGENTNFSQNL